MLGGVERSEADRVSPVVDQQEVAARLAVPPVLEDQLQPLHGVARPPGCVDGARRSGDPGVRLDPGVVVDGQLFEFHDHPG